MSVLGTLRALQDPSGIFILCVKSEESTAEQSRAKLGDLRHGEGERVRVSPAAVGWGWCGWMSRPGYCRALQEPSRISILCIKSEESTAEQSRAKIGDLRHGERERVRV